MNTLTIAPRPQGHSASGRMTPVVVVAAAIMVLLPYGLLLHALPITRDSGVFMYTGMLMNSGGSPYVDSWDHKGPLLYLFNALGFFLARGARGIVLLEGVVLFAALVASMHLWQRLVATRLVLVTAALFMLTYCVLFELGNLSETWLIPFTLITYSLAAAYCCEESVVEADRLLVWLCIGIGVSMAVALLTRPNNGLGLAWLACWLLGWGTRKRVLALALMAIAFVAIVLPVLFWLGSEGAWSEFVEQYLGYSLAYAQGADLKLRVLSAYLLLRVILLSPLGLGVVLLCALAWYAGTPRGGTGRRRACCWLMFAIFVVELLSQKLSGRSYLHYMLLATAPLAVMSVVLLGMLERSQRRVFDLRRNGAWALALLPAALIVMIPSGQALLAVLKQGTRIPGTPQNQLVERILQSTASSDLVLIHGADTWLLAATGRRAPSSITYHYPAMEGFSDTYQKYLSDTTSRKPLYIIEAPEGCGLTLSVCAGRPELFSGLRSFLAANYTSEGDLQGYRFWRLQGG